MAINYKKKLDIQFFFTNTGSHTLHALSIAILPSLHPASLNLSEFNQDISSINGVYSNGLNYKSASEGDNLQLED